MSIVHCWTSRYEADGFADRYDWAIYHRDEYPDFDIYAEDEGQAWYRDGTAICLLKKGHQGEHQFTPTKDIVVTFAPEAVTR